LLQAVADLADRPVTVGISGRELFTAVQRAEHDYGTRGGR
jgi:hypothetical protein